MQNQSHQPLDQSNNKVACELLIQSDVNGVVEFNCHWVPGDDGLIGLASIFYKLLIENFGEDIFKEIKNECVINNNEADYAAVVKLIDNHAQKNIKGQSISDVAVPPDQVFNV